MAVPAKRILESNLLPYVEKAKEEFEKCLKESGKLYYMDNYPKPRIPASELRTKDREGDSEGHFVKVDLSGGMKEAILKNYVREIFRHARKRLNVDHLATLLATFQADIAKSAYTLGFRAENDSEVRFMLGDPLIKLIVHFQQGYRVCTCCLFVSSSCVISCFFLLCAGKTGVCCEGNLY